MTEENELTERLLDERILKILKESNSYLIIANLPEGQAVFRGGYKYPHQIISDLEVVKFSFLQDTTKTAEDVPYDHEGKKIIKH